MAATNLNRIKDFPIAAEYNGLTLPRKGDRKFTDKLGLSFDPWTVVYTATKTISLELEAYEKLRRAKRFPRESFTEGLRRVYGGCAGRIGS